MEGLIHVLQHIFDTDLLGIANRPNRRETQPLGQGRFNNIKGRSTGTGDKINPLRIKLRYGTCKDTVETHIHQADAIGTNHGSTRLIHDVQHLLFQLTPFDRLLAKTGRDYDKCLGPLLAGQHLHNGGTHPIGN